MQQATQARAYDGIAVFRPQHGSNDVAPDGALRFGQIDQQGQPFAQSQMAQPAITTDLRKSQSPQLIRAIVIRPAMPGDAQGTRRGYHPRRSSLESAAMAWDAP